MDENSVRLHSPVRRRKRKPRWKRVLHKFWPPIRFCLLVVLFLCVLGGIIGGGIHLLRSWKPQDSLGSPTAPSTGEATEAPTLSQDDIRKQADALLKKADFIAAGYDYQQAIYMLEDFQYFDSVPELAARVQEYKDLDDQLIVYPAIGTVTHVFFHSLIVDADRAFDGDYSQTGYNQYMTTCAEFSAILQSMYDRGYILVSPYDVAREVIDEDGCGFTWGEIRIPEGKIPFVMSQDDVNYYGYMIGAQSGADGPIFANIHGDGFASRIVIGEDGFPTCEYMDAEGNVTTGDYDLVPILEHFIQEHPDFSYHGARAILGVTGYEGVFGYRTKPGYEEALGSEAYQKEVNDAKAVAQCLRDHGWLIASHSYGHPAYGKITAEKLRSDSEKWETTVQPIVGETDIILYPHGSDIAGTEQYTFNNEKFRILYDDGYRYFYNVDSIQYWNQLGSNYFRSGRRNLDGYRMYYNPKRLEDLFDVEEVFDDARPTPVPKI